MRRLSISKEKIINNIKNNKLILIVFLVIWIAIAGITLDKYSSSLGMKSFGNYYEATEVLEIDKKTTLKQTLELEREAKSISIKFATFARNNNGNVYIKVEGANTKKTYLDTSIKAENALDNAFMSFGFNEKIDNTKDRNIIITMTSNSDNAACIGVYYSQKAFENSFLTKNGQTIDGDIKVRFQRQHEVLGKFNTKIITFLLVSFTVLILFVVFCSKQENIFATITIVFGIVFMIVITPMSPPDEQKHYEYSYQLSSYIMGQGDNHMKIEHEYQDYTDCAGHFNVSSYYERLEESFDKNYKHNNHYEKISDGNDINDATYSLCYIPQAIAITIGRLLSLNFFGVFYAGRLFNLLFYVTCVYFAIRKTPMHKTLFGIIATTPIFIQQAASYSYDSTLNGLMLVIAAFFFDWYFKDGRISNKEVIELLLVVLFVTPLKRIYSLFIFCFLFVPYEKFGNKKRKIYSLSVLFIPLLIFLINFFYPYVTKFIRNYKETLNNQYQVNNDNNIISTDYGSLLKDFVTPEETGDLYYIGYITRNIGEVVSLYLHTIRVSLKIWFYESFGRVLSGVSLLLPTSLTHIMAIILLLAAILKEKFVLPIKEKISFVVISIAIGIFIMTGMLITWTCIGDEIVHGMQGRYFSPLLFFIMTIVNNQKIYLPAKFNKYLIYTQILMMFETIVYVLSYTFVN